MATVFQQNRLAFNPPAAISVNRNHPQAKGLIAFWPVLNNDGSTRLRNVVSAGDATALTGYKKITNQRGTAAAINGTQQFSATGLFPGTAGTTSYNVTLSARVFLNSVGSGTTENNEFFQRDNDSSSWGFQFQMIGNKLGFFIVNQTPAALSLAGLTALTTGRWYHVAASYDISRTLAKVYIDGKLDNSGTLSATAIRGTGTQYTIGATSNNARRINGAMADMRVYNRALSDAEVMDIYQNPMSVFTNQSNIMYSKPAESVIGGFNASQFFMVM